ncbi:MAG: hypothetical protein ACHQHN_13905 [Sphingobacteriales bacterium]
MNEDLRIAEQAKTERLIPVFTIQGTTFHVDIDQQVLRQTNNLANEISFINDMLDKGAYYEFLYDPIIKNVPRVPYNDETFNEVRVPPLVQLDPEGMSAKYGLPVSHLGGKTDFEVMVDQELFVRRLQGQLPRISLGDTEFIINVRRHEIHPASDVTNFINLKELELSPDGERYHFFLDLATLRAVILDPKMTALPSGVVLAEIPNELRLDPVGCAREYGIDEKVLLRRFPIIKNLTGKITPLSETWVMAQVQMNNKNMQQQRIDQLRSLRKSRGHKL